MFDVNDMELLRNYRQQGLETAFSTLVQRHVNLVYSVALRHVRNAAHAEEITQAVFVILASKAASLRPDTILEAWLYETARLTSLSFLRGERRRQLREQEAYMQSTLQKSTDASTWNQLAPLLDDAMARLDKRDREAVVLRFFKDKSLRDVAVALQITETAAQSRVYRAVEKLRVLLTRRGVALPAAALMAAISANSIQAAPAALAKTATAVAFAKGATVSSSTLTLIKGASKVIAWAKMKTAALGTAIVLLAVGTTTVTIKTIWERRTYPWQTPRAQSRMLETAPAEVRIVPSKFSEFGGWGYDRRGADKKVIGIGAPAREILQAAYGMPAARSWPMPGTATCETWLSGWRDSICQRCFHLARSPSLTTIPKSRSRSN